jgi:thiamine-monophosphate kinase
VSRREGGLGSADMGPGGEFDLIRRLLATWGERATGIGDDAAILDVPRGDSVVITVDTSIEEVHFRRAWITPREVGWRAATAAISDIAAMAAVPRALLLSVVAPLSRLDDLEEIAAGIGDASAHAGAAIIGGNTARGGELSITCTVIGSVFGESALGRAGACAGERLYVTGRLGGPGRAVAAWSEGREPASAFRERFARPVARIDEARWLARHGATACIDLSDGMASDAGHLAAASGVGLEIDGQRLPRLDQVTVEEAFTSGEEYELLVTSATELDVDDFVRRFGVPLTEIGAVAERRGEVNEHAVTLIGVADSVATLRGYDHLSG